MKIGISGGTGLIGKQLTLALLERKDEVIIFTRNRNPKLISNSSLLKYITTNMIQSIDLEGLDVLINLAGENIAGVRWTESAKQKFRNSRVALTENLVDSINACKLPPRLFLNASAIGFYGSYSDSQLQFNESSEQGDDYLSKLCADWEDATNGIHITNTLVRIARIGIVLDREGGALAKLLPIFKSFIGGPIGTGKQGMSWIHSKDLVSALIFLMEENRKHKIYNLTAPNPKSNLDFSKTLGKILHRPAIFPTPSLALDAIFGEGSVVVNKGQFVKPMHLLEEGFSFSFSELEAALQNLLN